MKIKREIKSENSLKFFGVMIDENLTWKTHVELAECSNSF